MNKQIAYTSDLHLDFFFKEGSNIPRALDHNFSKYFSELDSDTLIISGDISHHSPEYTTETLLELKHWLNLKHIITVNGNHDYWRITRQLKDRFASGLQLAAFRTDLYNANGIHALEGDYVEINGIRIGGCDSWYDGTIYYRMMANSMYGTSGTLDSFWSRTMNCSNHITTDEFHLLAKQQKDLLRQLKDQVDVMVTHVKPVVDNKYFPLHYQNDMTNAFYSFDFEEEIATDSRLTFALYGHTHTVEDWNFCGVQLLANPRGYPNEIKDKGIKHIEVTPPTIHK